MKSFMLLVDYRVRSQRFLHHSSRLGARFFAGRRQGLDPNAGDGKSSITRWKQPPIADNVDVKSLRRTLTAHIDANRASLIRKIPSFDPYRETTTLRPTFLEAAQNPQPEGESRRNLPPKKNGKVPPELSSLYNKIVRRRQRLAANWKANDELVEQTTPWMNLIHKAEGDASERINTEIQALREYMTPSHEEQEAAYTVMLYARRQIQELLPNFDIELAGSRATGLALPHSDLDLRLFLAPGAGEDVDHNYCLKELYRRLKETQIPEFQDNVQYVNAQTPIVRLRHVPSGLKLQIHVDNNSLASDEYAKLYQAEFPNIRGLYILIRTMLETRGLLGTFAGGMGSYCILMMIVASLKHGNAMSSASDLHRQLFYFLDMFGKADFTTTCIAVDPPSFFKKQVKASKIPLKDAILRGRNFISKVNKHQPYLMCLQDPANFMNDLGRKSFLIRQIQATFRRALMNLESEMGKWDSNGPTKEHSLLAPLVGANYSSFKAERKRIRYFQVRARGKDVDSVKRIL